MTNQQIKQLNAAISSLGAIQGGKTSKTMTFKEFKTTFKDFISEETKKAKKPTLKNQLHIVRDYCKISKMIQEHVGKKMTIKSSNYYTNFTLVTNRAELKSDVERLTTKATACTAKAARL